MRKFLLLLCSLFILSCSNEPPTIHDSQGRVITADKLKNKWVIVNYWATWCHHCIREIPELNRFYQENKDKNVLLFGVNYDGLSAKELFIFMQDHPIVYPLLQEDPGKTWHLSDVNGVPTTFILDPTGKMVKEILGPVSQASLTKQLNKLKEK